MKEDGVLLRWSGPDGKLYNRDERVVTNRYPEVVPFLPRNAVLVLEMCHFRWLLDERLSGDQLSRMKGVRVSVFEGGIQRRAGLERANEIRLRTLTVPCTAYVFDVLAIDGEDVSKKPLRDRRRAIEDLPMLRGVVGSLKACPGALGAVYRPCPLGGQTKSVEDAEAYPRVILAEQYPVADFDRLVAAVTSHGLEGLIVKDANAPYVAGRSPAWQKFKDWKGPEAFEVLRHETTDREGFVVYVNTRAGEQRIVVNDHGAQARIRRGQARTVNVCYLNHTRDGSLRQPWVRSVE